jgi:hypothetical protein
MNQSVKAQLNSLAVAIVALSFSAMPLAAGSHQRPLSDWLSQQGTTSVFFPPVPDLVGQLNCDDPPLQPTRFSLTDYTGNFNAWIKANGGPDLGTSVSGSVTEIPLADGRALVYVNTRAKNALTTVWGPTDVDFPGPLLFGRSAAEVAAGATGYALGENNMEIKFINTAPGDPLPNQVILFGNLPGILPGQELISWRYTARAQGELRAAFGVPDGTRGRFMTSQTGLLDMPPHAGDTCFGLPDVFPVETMFLQALGK